MLKAVRRREELLGRLRTLLLAKAATDGLPHRSAAPVLHCSPDLS